MSRFILIFLLLSFFVNATDTHEESQDFQDDLEEYIVDKITHLGNKILKYMPDMSQRDAWVLILFFCGMAKATNTNSTDPYAALLTDEFTIWSTWLQITLNVASIMAISCNFIAGNIYWRRANFREGKKLANEIRLKRLENEERENRKNRIENIFNEIDEYLSGLKKDNSSNSNCN